MKHFKIISGDSGKPKEKRIKRYARYRFFRCVRWSLLLRGIGSFMLYNVWYVLVFGEGMKAKVKKKNKQDATLININSLKKKLTALEMRVKLLEHDFKLLNFKPLKDGHE